MKLAINYSNDKFRKKQKFNTKTAYFAGGFDHVYEYSPSDIDVDFAKKYKHILDQDRGTGYWLWKPYFINKVLEDSNYDDYIFYCDSGAFFINKIDYLIKQFEKDEIDFMLFESPLIEQQWTNQYTIKEFSCDEDKYKFSNQFISSYMLIKKTASSVEFFQEYLDLCLNEKFLTDMKSSNLDLNFDHRHDQSILSLLAKKHGISGHKDPSDYGRFPLRYLQENRLFNLKNYGDEYPVIILSNRKVNPYVYLLKYLCRCILTGVFGVFRKRFHLLKR